ncbi:hypothetical protein PG985_002941 [Apiospora marii]|uniref:uncharacterized protein n=1 Tax=Apiospora marii TaxID=335849 RepID=UPI0031327067
MQSFIIAFVTFMVCLGANAASNITEVLAALPDGGYIMDMGVDENGLFGIADLGGKPVPGSPFTVNPGFVPPPTGHGAGNAAFTNTRDQWSCDARNETIDSASWKDAGSFLTSWCGAGNMVPEHKVVTWTENSSMAYLCNYAGPQNCDGLEYWNYMHFIGKECGSTGCGWFHQSSGNMTYGRGLKAGLSSPRHICYV